VTRASSPYLAPYVDGNVRLTRTLCYFFSLLATFALLVSPAQSREYIPTSRFTFVDIYLDAGAKPLAAYQIELNANNPNIKLVGIEAGDAKVFKNPPFYDPKAMAGDRIILAAYSTDAGLPLGRTRIARLHLEVVGNAQVKFASHVMAAASADASVIPVTIEVLEGARK